MVRFKPVKRKVGLTESARTRQVRQAQERARAVVSQPPGQATNPSPGAEAHQATDAFGSGAHDASGPSDEKLLRGAARARSALLAVALVMLLWYIVALKGSKTWGPELPVPTWALDVAALSPLVVLIRFWRPEARERSDTLEFDLKVFSGLYFFMSVLGAVLGGYWQLYPAIAISVGVHVGIWYTNRRVRNHG